MYVQNAGLNRYMLRGIVEVEQNTQNHGVRLIALSAKLNLAQDETRRKNLCLSSLGLSLLAPIAVHIKADLADEVAVLDALGEGVVLHRKTGQRFC